MPGNIHNDKPVKLQAGTNRFDSREVIFNGH